ncbi:MAG: U4 U6 small nuclear ribonucleo [Lasallia pustulata]|uniref:U4 U6 small nuclear ribonucleo n=1 Tax=Lasallia pustulata TaxID=136370 RepID=A0A5M8PY62_9LECA|nr:MAG: U4 U6 small nuclear ribonucleo [Lasallia pustulata]
MADVSSNGLKRPHPEDGLQTAQKKSRSNNGSPAPHPNGTTTATATAKPDISKVMAEAKAKAAAVAARLQGSRAGPNGLSSIASPAQAPTGASSGMSRMEEMKARVAAVTGKASLISQQRTASPAPTYQPTAFEEGALSRARGGLDVGLHPSLLGDSGQDARSSKGRQAIQPKFATTMANRRAESPVPTTKIGKAKKQLDLSGPSAEETRSNPYFDTSLGAKTATLKSRNSRQLVFNQKGKYIQQATALRRQAALEQMKKRIAESSRKAGIDEDLDTERAFLVQSPPDIEWWDEGLVNGKSYDAINSPDGLKIDTDDSIVTLYIQHPVALEPPQEKNMPAPKPMYLTAKEQAKLRRQRRMADLKEQQAKIRLGLEPAPPPKVKKSNLMRVLGEEAVKDPTAVEARVNREIAERAQKHVEMNEERKLTKDQQHEKLAEQQEKDAAKGIYSTVYKIDNLANGRHRFKISKNAEQNALTGICILHPRFCLVIVEGGEHSISFYKKLMLNRIDWTENSAPNSVREGNKEALASWLQAENEKGELKDLGLNKCVLVWEGEEKTRAFRKWGTRVCETDGQAKDVLARSKMENFWTLAKSLK